MKEYTKPSVEIVKFDVEDIIQESGALVYGGTVGDFTTGGASAGWGVSQTSLFD